MSSSQRGQVIGKKRTRLSSQTAKIPASIVEDPSVELGDDDEEQIDAHAVSEELTVPTIAAVQEPLTKKARNYIENKGRSEYWKHFKKYLDDEGNVRAECIYCLKTYSADSKSNGTKNVNKHWQICQDNPENKAKGTIQSKLLLEKVDESGQGKMRNWVLNQAEGRIALTKMIIMDELPFKQVEKPGLKCLLACLCPTFKLPSRFTVARDCYAMYLRQKILLKSFIKENCQRVCITTDSWTSIQKVNYACITAHFIDNDWELQKRILNFCPVVGHKGEDIARGIDDCLRPWGLSDKVLTITVDNCSSNDSAMTCFKELMRLNGNCINKAHNLHMRCAAHIANLIVSDGLKLQVECIDKVRAFVKYVRGSPSRIKWFKEEAEKLRVQSQCSLVLDVPTRWNSTYTMLEVALKFKNVFPRMDPPRNAKGESVGHISVADWKKIEVLVSFLKEFYDFTKEVSASSHVTVNNVFFYIGNIIVALESWMTSSDMDCVAMAYEMQEKCMKYWDSIEKMNMLIFVAIILDPTYKLEMVEMGLLDLYGKDKAEEYIKIVKTFACGLFDEYKKMYGTSVAPIFSDEESSEMSSLGSNEKASSKFLSKLSQKRKMLHESDAGLTEFDRYLSELPSQCDQSQILTWWKLNETRYPIVAHMARDILAIPISTVPSESVFSTGGRTLDKFRSCLTPKTVQGLICTQDWLLASVKSSVDDEGDSTSVLIRMEDDVENEIPTSELSLADREPIYF